MRINPYSRFVGFHSPVVNATFVVSTTLERASLSYTLN